MIIPKTSFLPNLVVKGLIAHSFNLIFENITFPYVETYLASRSKNKSVKGKTGKCETTRNKVQLAPSLADQTRHNIRGNFLRNKKYIKKSRQLIEKELTNL